jgi:putative redox protein
MSTSTPTVTVRHLDGDRLRIQVRGHELLTDQPVEEGGEDTAPTPTELFLASLAACAGFYAERFLRRHELPTEGLVIACEWAWAHDPMRVGGVELTVDAPGLTPERYQAFERVIEHCTIHNTLRKPPEVRFKVLTEPRISAA